MTSSFLQDSNAFARTVVLEFAAAGRGGQSAADGRGLDAYSSRCHSHCAALGSKVAGMVNVITSATTDDARSRKIRPCSTRSNDLQRVDASMMAAVLLVSFLRSEWEGASQCCHGRSYAVRSIVKLSSFTQIHAELGGHRPRGTRQRPSGRPTRWFQLVPPVALGRDLLCCACGGVLCLSVVVWG